MRYETKTKHLFNEPIAQLPLRYIKRKDLLDYRSRLLTKLNEATANKVMKAVKTIFKEALLREDIERDPTVGIGMAYKAPV